jgi:hypothetical protein
LEAELVLVFTATFNFQHFWATLSFLAVVFRGGLFFGQRAIGSQIPLFTQVLQMYRARGNLTTTVDLETNGQIRHQVALKRSFAINNLSVKVVAIVNEFQLHQRPLNVHVLFAQLTFYVDTFEFVFVFGLPGRFFSLFLLEDFIVHGDYLVSHHRLTEKVGI